jgi:hypothetical protein
MNAHYFEVEDIDYWIDKNKETVVRWQEEMAFVMQLKADMTLQEIFGIVINKREHTSGANTWFFMGIMINRAFDNRFNMAFELVGEAERDTELLKNHKLLDGVKTELNHLMEMTRLFEDEEEEEGTFKILYEKNSKGMESRK